MKDLRTIFLLDLEANHTYKSIGRDTMQADIEHIQISPEQYRIPQRSSVAHGINWRLIFDYQQPFSLACSDLKSCYDIIVHSASRIAFKRLGIPLQ